MHLTPENTRHAPAVSVPERTAAVLEKAHTSDMNKRDLSRSGASQPAERRANPAGDPEHRREFVDRIQRRARELRERADQVQLQSAGAHEPSTKG